MARGQALLDVVSQLDSSTQLEKSFWVELSVIAFVPVHTNPPAKGLPWPEGDFCVVAPPRMVRAEEQMWMVSGSMRILKGTCTPSAARKFGFHKRPTIATLAAQLLELGKLHARVSKRGSAFIPSTYHHRLWANIIGGTRC